MPSQCRNRSKRYVLLSFTIALAIVLCLVSAALAQEGVTGNDTIKELLQKRLVIAKEIHSLVLEAYKKGESDFRAVIESQQSMLLAQLDLCETKADRVKVHQEMVSSAENMLEVLKKLAESGDVWQVDVLKAEAHLIESKIGLERAKESK